MAFLDDDQILNKIYDAVNNALQVSVMGSKVGIENQQFTATGQVQVATTENFWTRMAREGKWKPWHQDKLAFAATTSWLWNWATQAETGFRLYPKKIILSADVTCELGVKLQTGTASISGTGADADPIFCAYVTAGTPFIIDFDGEMYMEDFNYAEGAGIYIGVNNAASAGNLYFTMHMLEVAFND